MLVTVHISDLYRTCNILQVFSINHNGQWLVRAEVTNLSKSNTEYTRLMRGYLSEYLMLINGQITRLGVDVHGCAENKRAKGDRQLILSSSTKGWPESEAVRREDTTSTRNALEYGKVEKLKVQESDSLSVAALPLMPAVLSLFPLALFQDASLPASLAYAVATDVLSVLPLAIKGVELLIFGSRKHYAQVTDLSGVSHTRTASFVSTWVSECGMKPYIWRRGMAFVMAAVAQMTFGAALEVLSRRALSRKKKVCTWTGFAVLDDDVHVKTFLIPQRRTFQ